MRREIFFIVEALALDEYTWRIRGRAWEDIRVGDVVSGSSSVVEIGETIESGETACMLVVQSRPYQALLLRFNFLCVFRKLCNPQHTCITRSRISPQCIRIFSATMR